MTAQEVLKMAFDCGIDLQVQGNNLRLNAKKAPPNHVIAEIKQHKSDLLLILAANDTPPPYTSNELLKHYEKPLFNHLLDCPYCHVEKAQYCLNGYAMGSVYDALLLNRDNAQAKRANLALRVDRAKIKGSFR